MIPPQNFSRSLSAHMNPVRPSSPHLCCIFGCGVFRSIHSLWCSLQTFTWQWNSGFTSSHHCSCLAESLNRHSFLSLVYRLSNINYQLVYTVSAVQQFPDLLAFSNSCILVLLHSTILNSPICLQGEVSPHPGP